MGRGLGVAAERGGCAAAGVTGRNRDLLPPPRSLPGGPAHCSPLQGTQDLGCLEDSVSLGLPNCSGSLSPE